MSLSVAAIRTLVRRFDARRLRYGTLSLADAVGLFRGLRGRPVVMLSRVEAREVRKLGTPHPYRNCCVVKRREVLLNVPYERAVNERRAREKKPADFVALPRSWGETLGLPLVAHYRDLQWHLYLSLHVARNLGVEYFTWDMDPLPHEEVRKYLRPPRRGGSRQGLRKEVVYRDYELGHVLALWVPGDDGRDRGLVVDAVGIGREAGRQAALFEARRGRG